MKQTFQYNNAYLAVSYKKQDITQLNLASQLRMQTQKLNHSCQIDCSNREEVINALQKKSKDLYYFWRNYQWLYNRYYGQKGNSQSQYRQMESAYSMGQKQKIQKLTIENRQLLIQNQKLNRQLQAMAPQPNNHMTELNNKIICLQQQKEQINYQYKNCMKSKQEVEESYRADRKKYQSKIQQLQQQLGNKRNHDQSLHYQQYQLPITQEISKRLSENSNIDVRFIKKSCLNYIRLVHHYKNLNAQLISQNYCEIFITRYQRSSLGKLILIFYFHSFFIFISLSDGIAFILWEILWKWESRIILIILCQSYKWKDRLRVLHNEFMYNIKEKLSRKICRYQLYIHWVKISSQKEKGFIAVKFLTQRESVTVKDCDLYDLINLTSVKDLQLILHFISDYFHMKQNNGLGDVQITLNNNNNLRCMKKYTSVSQTITNDLKKILPNDVFHSLKQRFMQEQKKLAMMEKCQSIQKINTPSTIATELKKKGSAIFKSRRPLSSRGAKTLTHGLDTSRQGIELNNQIRTAANGFGEMNAEDKKESVNCQTHTQNSKIVMDRAVYYGNVDLPYLHSTDVIACLYQSNKVNNQMVNPQAFINPPPSTAPSFLINIKNLYLYYTPLDSVRQLGTGWRSLKSLTVMCSYQLRDLSGLSIFPSLQCLFVPHNNISDISDLMYHPILQCVDLEDNQINSVDQIQYLYTINNLQWTDITSNPITKEKQKYRIVCEKLGNKLQMQIVDKAFQYEIKQTQLDNQFISYENIQISNNLIKEINDQILEEQIKVNEVWRISQQKKLCGKWSQTMENADIQIITSSEDSANEEEQMEQCGVRNSDSLRLRVTALASYIKPEMSFDPLKKYFYNKIFSQQRQKFQSPKTSKYKTKDCTFQSWQIEQPKGNIQIDQKANNNFSATQNLQSVSNIYEKKRISSVSIKKRFDKSSLGISRYLDVSNAPLSKRKEDSTSSINQSHGLKYFAKRRFMNWPSNNFQINQ